jgi:hypothetical protein
MRLVGPMLVLAVGGCAPPHEPTCQGLTPLEIHAQAQLDCAAVVADVEIVRTALAGAPERWRLQEVDFEGTFRGLRVCVHADPTFTRDGRSWVGRYDLVDGVELGSRGDALPHELLHALDVQRGQWLTSSHAGWDWTFDDEVTGRMSGTWSI